MGMSASQARLLSITTRLTNNEFRSQMTANSKVRLANETQAATDEYMNALNATKLEYVYYDAKGNRTNYKLTAGTMLQYEPLKNQYALVNRAGQTMVNHGDATTFKQATDLDHFLELNDCIKVTKWTEPNPEWQKWNDSKPDPQDKKFYDVYVSQNSELYNKFLNAGDYCYDQAINHNGSGCYLHVLQHLIDFKNTAGEFNPAKQYQTTTGNGSITITSASGGMCSAQNCADMAEVSDAICNGYQGQIVMAPDVTDTKFFKKVGEDPATGTEFYEYSYEDENGISHTIPYKVFHTGNAEADALLSNTKADGSLKTFKEKIIDLYYLVQNYGSLGIDYETALKPALLNFNVEMSMAFKEEIFNQKRYDDALKLWKKGEPDEELNFREREVLDPDKEEWYTNLWYRMNGALFDEEFMQSVNDADYNELKEKYYNKTADSDQSWVEFDETLINSQEWLQFALEAGEISLEKVVFNTNYDTTTELVNKSWVSTTWSSTTDIIEVEDEVAIKKAEVKYNQALRDIQAKDKRYENDIKKLDTEHNALQTEYDSIKGVMDKNMERSFKAFS